MFPVFFLPVPDEGHDRESFYLYHKRSQTAMDRCSPFRFSRLFLFFLLCLLVLPVSLSGQRDSLAEVDPVRPYPPWMLWVPGATHFADGRPVTGLTLALGQVGAIGLGLAYDRDLRSETSSPYYNYPLLLGMQLFNVDKCDFMRNQMLSLRSRDPSFRFDDLGFNQLLLEPFRPKNIFTPITGLFILVAVGQLYLESRDAGPPYRDVRQMYVLDRYRDRDPAMAVMGMTSLLAGWGAGVGEEYWFRNSLMPIWDYRFGQKKGLIYSSLLFGSMHLGNLLFEPEPDLKAALIQAAEATVAGWLLGKDVQHRGYDIGPAVAAHTWYDLTLMLGSFLVNPEDNVFGVSVRFAIP